MYQKFHFLIDHCNTLFETIISYAMLYHRKAELLIELLIIFLNKNIPTPHLKTTHIYHIPYNTISERISIANDLLMLPTKYTYIISLGDCSRLNRLDLCLTTFHSGYNFLTKNIFNTQSISYRTGVLQNVN